MIDWNQVLQLRGEVGEEDFEEVVELFLEEVDGVVSRLRKAVDPAMLEEDMHFLKGSALSLGFSAFSKLCQDGEYTAAKGQPDSVNVSDILDCYDASRAVFLKEMAQRISA